MIRAPLPFIRGNPRGLTFTAWELAHNWPDIRKAFAAFGRKYQHHSFRAIPAQKRA